jgi:trehalose 6-phosphate synthase
MRDGMNLVAKEYVAAQDPTDPGVLILSRFAGAAEQLTDALIVNPYNVDEIADAIEAALQMGREERIRRNAELLEGIIRRDTFAWSRAFLDALNDARAQQDSATGGPPPDELRNKLRQLARRAGRRDSSSKEKSSRERDPPGNNSALQQFDRPLGQR